MRSRSRLVLAVVLAGSTGPAVAAAQVAAGLSVGYGVPVGNAFATTSVGNAYSVDVRSLYRDAFSLEGEALWSFSEHLSAGLYASYASLRTRAGLTDCARVPCARPHGWRVGGQMAWRFGSGPVRPWLGLAAGLENARFQSLHEIEFVHPRDRGPPPFPPPPPPSSYIEHTLRGWEAGLRGGADWIVAPPLAVGVFAAATAGQYRVWLHPGSTYSPGGGIDQREWHYWVTVGLRVRFQI